MITLTKLNREIPSLFTDLFQENLMNGFDCPKINRSEDEKSYKIDVFYPGVKRENFKIKVEKNKIVISSNLEQENDKKEEKYHFVEHFSKEFSRTFILPENVLKNEINAFYEDGVLKILIPKDKEKERQSNFEIKIK